MFTRWSELELIKRKDGGAETKRGIEKDVMRKMGKRYAGEITCTVVMNVLDTVKVRGASRLALLIAYSRNCGRCSGLRSSARSSQPTRLRALKKHVGGHEEERDRVLSEAEVTSLPVKLEP